MIVILLLIITIFTELASELEDKIESSKAAIGSFTTAGASAAGE